MGCRGHELRVVQNAWRRRDAVPTGLPVVPPAPRRGRVRWRKFGLFQSHRPFGWNHDVTWMVWPAGDHDIQMALAVTI